jgi:hypothetical protein
MKENEKLGFGKSVRSQKRSRAGGPRHASFYSCVVTRRLGPDGPVKHLPPQATSFASSHQKAQCSEQIIVGTCHEWAAIHCAFGPISNFFAEPIRLLAYVDTRVRAPLGHGLRENIGNSLCVQLVIAGPAPRQR